MHAELVRVSMHEVDIKIVSGDRMHVLQWRRNLLWDEVLLDGKRQASSHGLWGREKVYGLVFGRDADGRGGQQVMLILDPGYGSYDYTHNGQRIKGVRLEGVDGTLVSFGSLDAKALEENVRAFTDAVVKAKPTGAKGNYVKKVAISSTMGPGVKLDPASVLAS